MAHSSVANVNAEQIITVMMNGSHGGDLASQSLGSHGSNSSMRRRRKIKDQTCFCGFKKSGTRENPDRLREATASSLGGVDDDGYEAGTETDVEVDGNYDEWRLNMSWRVGSLDGEVRAMKMLIITNVMKLCIFLAVTELVLFSVSLDMVTGCGWTSGGGREKA
ncbi:uncharacterized protein DS421_6g198570 [Arachis hypogaea]|nr:uncharacterized protein DS421_6g198570 [Arachis hypogaea]